MVKRLQGALTRLRNNMVTSSRFLMGVSPTHCSFCGEPLPSRDGHIESWRASDGRHFCSEFCADDAEEAQFQTRANLRSMISGWRVDHF